MNQRIDSTSEFSPIERGVLLLLTTAVLALVFFSSTPQDQPVVNRGFQLTLHPWITAGGVSVSSGLDVFSGLPLSPPTEGQRLSMLAGVLLGLVVGPTLLLLSWRRSKTQPPGGKSRTRLGFLIGGMLVYALALPAIPIALLQWNNYRSMQAAQAAGEERDEVIYALQLILRDAREYKILPAAEGGGNGTFAGYALPVSLSGNQYGNYEVETRTDSVLILKGVPTHNPSLTTVATLKADGTLTWNNQTD
jgi:hypothetical protein